MIKAMLVKLLTVKAAAGLAVATTAGGVALASTTGVLPGPLSADKRSPQAAAQAVASARPAHGEGGRAADKPSPDRAAKDGDTGPAGAHGSPSPSLVGLCHAHSAGNKADHGKALESPAFRALINAAGGREKVTSFCAALLASPPASQADPKNRGDRPAGDDRSRPGDAADAGDTTDAGDTADQRTGGPAGNGAGKPGR